MEQETTTTTEEYTNYVAYAYFDGQLYMDEKYYQQATEIVE